MSDSKERNNNANTVNLAKTISFQTERTDVAFIARPTFNRKIYFW